MPYARRKYRTVGSNYWLAIKPKGRKRLLVAPGIYSSLTTAKRAALKEFYDYGGTGTVVRVFRGRTKVGDLR